MAKKKKEVELKEVSRTEINGAIIIKYEDGSVKIIPAPIMLSAEEAEDLFGSESDEEEEEEEVFVVVVFVVVFFVFVVVVVEAE